MDTKFDFGPETGERIVYVRPVAVADLPDEVRQHAMGLETIYAVHAASGERLASSSRASTTWRRSACTERTGAGLTRDGKRPLLRSSGQRRVSGAQ